MSAQTIETGGLIGAFRRFRLPSWAPLSLMTRLAGIAALVLIVKKSNLQNISSANWDVVVVAMTLGLVAVVGEYQFARETYRAWREREVPTLLLCSVLWAAAFAYSCNNWLGTASEGQVGKANAQKAAFRTAEALRSEKEKAFSEALKAGAAEERIRNERWKPLPKVNGQDIGSAAEAQAILDGQKAKTRFWDLTKNCTESTGPQTRAFVQVCSEARAAIKADDTRKALEDTHKELIAKKAAADAKFEEAKASEGKGPQAEDGERADLMIYTNWIGVSAQNAVLGQAVGMIAFVSLLLSGLGLLKEREEYAGKPSKPWGIAAKLRAIARWGKSALFGRDTIKGETRILKDITTEEAAKVAFGKYAAAA